MSCMQDPKFNFQEVESGSKRKSSLHNCITPSGTPDEQSIRFVLFLSARSAAGPALVIDCANLPGVNANKSTLLTQIAGQTVPLSVTTRVGPTMACEKHDAQPDSKESSFHVKARDTHVGRRSPRLLSSHLLSLLFVFGVLVLAIYHSNSIVEMGHFKSLLGNVAFISTLGASVAKPCHLTTVQSSIPSDGSEIALQSYSYCGGKLNITVCHQIAMGARLSSF